MRDLRALGYIRDTSEKRALQHDARPLIAAARRRALNLGSPLHEPPYVPDIASLEQFEAAIMDQGPTSSCTGHGTSQALVVAFAAAGHPLPWVPSQKGIYTVGRELDTADPMLALADSGAMPANVMAGITKVGLRPMGIQAPGRFSDCDIATINARDTLSELEEDVVRCIVGQYRIDETAIDVIDQVCATIAHANAPVGVGVFVDSLFEAFNGGAPVGAPNQADPNGGGHWMCVTSYRTGDDGRRIFRGPNSWGVGWGSAGHFEVDESWIRSCWDLYAMTVQRAS